MQQHMHMAAGAAWTGARNVIGLGSLVLRFGRSGDGLGQERKMPAATTPRAVAF